MDINNEIGHERNPNRQKMICLYFLIKDDHPYYVGVTTREKGRYSDIKKKHMEIIEYHDNRISAKQSETYWIAQLKAWGFNLENKHTTAKRIQFVNPLATRVRFTPNKSNALFLKECDVRGYDISTIINLALETFAPKMKNNNFTWDGIDNVINGKRKWF